MHSVLFLGIFGLPAVAGVGMLLARVLTAFAPQDPPGPGCLPPDDLLDTESHVGNLVHTFLTPPSELNPPQ